MGCRFRVVPLAAVGALFSCTGAKDAKPHTATVSHIVTVTATDYAFDAPAAIG